MRERTWSMNFMRWNWVFCHLDKEIDVYEIKKRKEIIEFLYDYDCAYNNPWCDEDMLMQWCKYRQEVLAAVANVMVVRRLLASNKIPNDVIKMIIWCL